MTVSAAGDTPDPQVARAHARTGHTLRGKWHLDRLLGVGGMAAVYSATHRNGTRAAVKLLHPELSPHDEVKSRFLKEGYLANKVEHPGVVRVLDDDVAEDGSIYLVMDLLDGESVEARRERKGGCLDADEILSIADQVLSVLTAAHNKGIVHRDVKPENIFLTRDGVIKVLDFGIARLRELSSTAKSDTQTGSTLGTPAYMAPEHARGLWEEVDAQSDLWSLGAAMFNLATGRLVHEGRTVNEQLAAAIVNRATPVRAVDPQVPAPLAELIDKALAYEKAERWPDARAMQQATRVAYDSIRHAPIESCPPLAVPESVPDRTAVAVGAVPPAPRLPSDTGVSVVSGRTGVPLRISGADAVPRNMLIGIGIAATSAVVALFIVVSALIDAGPPSAGAAPSVPASAATTPSARPAAELAPANAAAPSASATPASSAPQLSITDLPLAPPGAGGGVSTSGRGTRR
ncbi:MAG: serine/threonine protein kinase [Polyangiaceae bacterium]|nr:serine/threonine protein kinase [Polyangiaceae bacterium]